MPYILYKNPIQLDTLDYVRFLFYHGIDAKPKYCVERNWGIYTLPAIKDLDTSDIYYGKEGVKYYYSTFTNMNAEEFEKQVKIFKLHNPDYKINTS